MLLLSPCYSENGDFTCKIWVFVPSLNNTENQKSKMLSIIADHHPSAEITSGKLYVMARGFFKYLHIKFLKGVSISDSKGIPISNCLASSLTQESKCFKY